MGNKLFVGNLTFSVNDESLHEMFAKHGSVVSAKIITDRESGRSKGFGFVEMSSPAEAAEAINALNGKDSDGRQMNVSEAKPQAPRENRGGSFGRNQSRGGGW